ncbi:MAG TPA: hypothetical protein DD471_05485 [Planctomycetes bacterium]|jgi:hypothetical protein|nr:hypothetical protein [Planctomycetota bacterium]
MLEVTCNGCGAKYKAPEKFAGRKMSCKACSEVMLIGEEAAPEVSSSPVEEEVSQAPVASEEKVPSKKKPSFKKGGISARKGDKKSSFKKGGLSSSKVSRDSDRGSADQAAGSKKSPALLVVILLLLVGGLAAVDFFVTNMVIGGKAPAGNEKVAAVDDSPEKEPAEEPADEPEAPAEPEETEPEAGKPEVAEPAPEKPEGLPAEPEAPALAAISATSSPVALLVPADAQVILGLNIPRLIAAYEGLTGEKLPRTPEALASMNPGDETSEADLEAVKKAIAAGVDPFNSIRSILIAAELPENSPIPGLEDFGAAGAAAAESDGLVLVEGQFSDPAAIVSALVELGVLSPSAPEVKAGLNVYSVAEGQSIKGRFTFLSTGQMMFATSAWLDKVIARRKGEGQGILTNAVFNSMSKGLARKEALWLVADVPEEAGAALQQGLAVPPGGIPGPDDGSEAPTPAIKIDSLMLALDSGGTDFSLELIGVTPSPEHAENTKTTIGTQLGGISLLAMQMLGPKALGLMGKLTPKSDGNNVIISLKLNEKELAAVKEMATKALAGFAGPDSEAPEGFDPSDFIKEPPGQGKAAVDPGDEGEEPEKEEDGKGEDDPLELEDF